MPSPTPEEKETGLAMLEPRKMISVALQSAINQGSAIDVVKVILEQQKWMILHDEEERFNAALKRLQKKLQAIQKKGYNKDTKSHFATSFDVHNAIQPHLDEEGMTLSFRPGISDKPDMVLIIGLLSLGALEKEYPLEMPADGKGAKGGGAMSRTHATGAAIKYAKRYLKDMIFDLNTYGPEDDGNDASGLTDAQLNLVSDISNAASIDDLEVIFKAAFKIAFNAGDQKAQKAYIAAKDRRKVELQNEPTED